jgi:hypothetical protein
VKKVAECSVVCVPSNVIAGAGELREAKLGTLEAFFIMIFVGFG